MSDFDSDSSLFPIKFEAGIFPVIVEPDVPDGIPLEGLAHSAFKDNAPQVSATSARIDPPRGGVPIDIGIHSGTGRGSPAAG